MGAEVAGPTIGDSPDEGSIGLLPAPLTTHPRGGYSPERWRLS